MPPHIQALFAGGPKTLHDDAGTWRSSIQRTRIETADVEIRGIAGDKATKSMHGGPDSALCVHLAEHYDFWRDHHQLTFPHGHLGENLTLTGLPETEINVGDIVRLGTVFAQVSGPRVPCSTQSRQAGRPDWVKQTIAANRTGFYLRVLEPGRIQPGDAWQLQQRLNEDAGIPAINQCMYLDFNPAYAQRLTTLPALSDWWRQQAKKKLANPAKRIAG